LHFEVRTNQAILDGKLNSVLADYNAITAENTRMKKQAEQLSRDFTEVRCMEFKQKIIDDSV
jgi:hypothetical protein